MRALVVVASLALGMAVPFSARACGACIEDKVAATYDQTVIDRSVAARRQVVFVAIDGPVAAESVTRRVVATAARVRGVQPGSVRTSISPPAFSFVLDATQDPQSAVAAFARELRNPDARLVAVRVLRDGALLEPD